MNVARPPPDPFELAPLLSAKIEAYASGNAGDGDDLAIFVVRHREAILAALRHDFSGERIVGDVRAAMARHGLTNRDLARELGVTDVRAGMALRVDSNPTINTLARIWTAVRTLAAAKHQETPRV